MEVTVAEVELLEGPIGPEDGDVCWICLGGDTDNGERLERPCRCPRSVHLKCLARWQLQNAGKNEEDKCRFCSALLPDWKSTFTPRNVKPVIPVMAIKFEGKTYKLKVKPGPDGLREFQNQVRVLLGFDITDEFDVTFECQVPQTGEKMKLTGLSSYGAATHCAAITAAQRNRSRKHRHHRHQRSQQPSDGNTPSSDIPGPSQDAAAAGVTPGQATATLNASQHPASLEHVLASSSYIRTTSLRMANAPQSSPLGRDQLPSRVAMVDARSADGLADNPPGSPSQATQTKSNFLFRTCIAMQRVFNKVLEKFYIFERHA